MVLLISIIIFFKIINTVTLSNILSNNLYEAQRQKRSILTDKSRLWAEKEILYHVDPILDHTFIKVALFRISKETCLTFKRVISPKKALFVYLPGKNYETTLGRGREIPHRIFVSIFYKDIGKIIRETMYSLGVDYEHNRFDRDSYIEISFNNIKHEYLKYFIKNNVTSATSFGTKYDCRSVMHFSPYDYAKHFLKVFRSKDSLMEKFMGKSKYLTFSDAQILNKKYCSYPKINYPICFRNGYQHPRIPTTCKCLPFYFGNNCQATMQNANECTQMNLFYAARSRKREILNVGGKCFFFIRTDSGKKIKLALKFLNVRQNCLTKCSEENSIEIKTDRDLSVSGYLHCPNGKALTLVSMHNMIAILTNYQQSNIQLQIIYRRY